MCIYIYIYIYIIDIIVRTAPPPPPERKRGGIMVHGQFFLKEGLLLFLFNFSRYIIFTFRNYFTLSKTVLCI